ncbi:DNA replication complex GINS protein PSF3 [Kappamyces sp. JEL0829]|nr:DNA replication complex GINS protein PSF3 [Kappamyces sp. JEL0829]
MSDYWSLESILAQETKLKCQFSNLAIGQKELHGLGMMEMDKDLKAELPFWMAEPLAQEEYLTLMTPAMFQSKVLDELRASCAVNLSQHSNYFYLFAALMIKVMEMAPDFSNLMVQTFRDRLVRVNDFSQNPQISLDSRDFLMFLDETEKELYRLGVDCVQSMQRWENRHHLQIKPSFFLTGGQKRKRIE